LGDEPSHDLANRLVYQAGNDEQATVGVVI